MKSKAKRKIKLNLKGLGQVFRDCLLSDETKVLNNKVWYNSYLKAYAFFNGREWQYIAYGDEVVS